MNITKSQLTRIIREEVERGLNLDAAAKARPATPNEQIVLATLKNTGNELEILHLKGILDALAADSAALTAFNAAVEEARKAFSSSKPKGMSSRISLSQDDFEKLEF